MEFAGQKDLDSLGFKDGCMLKTDIYVNPRKYDLRYNQGVFLSTDMEAEMSRHR